MSYNDSLKPLVGTWSSEGETALIVENQGDRLLIRNPPNDTWRFEITDTTVEGNSIRFKQRNYLIDGQDHPFSGMECRVEISPVAGDPDGLRYSLTTPQMLKAETEVFRRVE